MVSENTKKAKGKQQGRSKRSERKKRMHIMYFACPAKAPNAHLSVGPKATKENRVRWASDEIANPHWYLVGTVGVRPLAV